MISYDKQLNLLSAVFHMELLWCMVLCELNPKRLKKTTKTAEVANCVEPDEVAHNEPPHLGLHCLHCSL